MAKNGRRSKLKKQSFSIANKLFPVAKAATPVVAFLEQISAKDRKTLGESFSKAKTMDQLKIMTNIVTGRLAGFGLFHANGMDATIPPQTINPSGIINKWTMGGLGAIGYGILGNAINTMSKNMGLGSVIPATSKVSQLGKGAFAGGLFGGFFDDPVDDGRTTSHNIIREFPSLRNVNNQVPVLQLSNAPRSVSGDGDSVESGF